MAYATLQDFYMVLPASSFGDRVSPSQIQQILEDVSQQVNTMIGDKVNTPIVPYIVPTESNWPFDRALTRNVCKMAAYECICLRGFNPDNPGDRIIEQQNAFAMQFFKDVANGKLSIRWKETSPASLQPDIYTNCQRGFGSIPGLGSDVPFINGMNNN